MSQQQFNALMGKFASRVADKPLGEGLEAFLNTEFPVGSDEFTLMAGLCQSGEAEGWLMARKAGGIKFGCAIKPGSDAGVFSVDVVRMKDVKGPHHVHTTGEIGAIMPINGVPLFDGRGAGWYVYAPGSSHHPTVTGGDAYVLYFLPEGAIEFTGK